MSCTEHEDAILDVARGVASEIEAAALLRHAAECPSCAQALRRERAVTAGLRALDAATAGDGASPGVRAALLAAFPSARHAATTPDDRGAVASRPRRWPLGLATAAALVLVAGGSLMFLRDAPAPVPGDRPPLAGRPLPGGLAVGSLVPTAERQRANVALAELFSAAPSAGSKTPAAGDSALEPAPFVPWPGAAALPAFDNGELVRTELPASVLPLLGIAGASPAAETVAVDVVVGQDGFARAVRLARR